MLNLQIYFFIFLQKSLSRVGPIVKKINKIYEDQGVALLFEKLNFYPIKILSKDNMFYRK